MLPIPAIEINEARYHFNNITGRVGKCRAKKKCPFGDMDKDHYNTKEEAAKAFENLQELFGPGIIKDSLKTMDANDLAAELFHHVKELNLDEEEFEDILELSSILHAKQYRKNRLLHPRTPYIEHPLRATLRIIRSGVKDPAIIKAALLHDTVEDGSKTFTEIFTSEKVKDEKEARKILSSYIGQNFGKETERVVLNVTNDVEDPAEKKKRTLQDKTRIYVEHLKIEIKDNPRALIVKGIGDFFDNAGSLHHTDKEGNEQKTYNQAYKYLPCIDVFREELSKPNPYATEDMRQEWLVQLDRIESRLEFLIQKYKKDYGS